MLSIYFYRDLPRVTNPTFTPATNHSSSSQFYNNSSQLWNETMENATRDNVEVAQILFDLDNEIISQREQGRRMGLNFCLAAKSFESAMKSDSRKKQKKINQNQNSKLTPLKQIKSNRKKANATFKFADHGLSEVHGSAIPVMIFLAWLKEILRALLKFCETTFLLLQIRCRKDLKIWLLITMNTNSIHIVWVFKKQQT